MFFECKVLSSLEKVFCRKEWTPSGSGLPTEQNRFAGAGGEVVSFQLALRAEENFHLTFHAEGVLAEFLEFREVGLVPCEKPADPVDPFVITSEPGIFPDPLQPIRKAVRIGAGNWHSVWVTVRIPRKFAPGVYPVNIRIDTVELLKCPWKSGVEVHLSQTVFLEVLPFALPPQKLISVNWFYADCIAEYYGLKPWSEAFWRMLGKYFRNMAEHGNNILYTPLWTVPLDTAIDGERPTVQLLKITLSRGKYSFDFSLLKRWIELARKNGIEQFEMSHAFTQWGAKHAPKIFVNVNGKEVRKFGWDTDAMSSEYTGFLGALLPELTAFLRKMKLSGKCFFHISDEPSLEVLEDYRKASALFGKYLDDEEFPVIDALSNVEFFREGLLRRPVPCTSHVHHFALEKVRQRWCYYCGNWSPDLPNRSYGMPSVRNRVLGLLLYLYKMDGFLHWGYNFWFSQYSADWHLDPWKDTTAGRAFCGGNSFNVYPGEDGPVDSIHYEVYREALQDLRLFQLLEEKIGREKCVALLQQGVPYPIEMSHYPHSNEWLLEVRNRAIEELKKENR